MIQKITYKQLIKTLYNLPKNIKLGLNRIQKLLKLLNNPEKHYDIIHIAGTNGKGSICAFTDYICRNNKIETGKFTSPHLYSIRERIIICGQSIHKQHFTILANKVLNIIKEFKEDKPSFFECIFAIALLAFKDANIKLAIIEVGLGGRLDATNIIHPTISVIGSINIDHKKLLGCTINDITKEKIKIIKFNIPIITIQQNQHILKNIKSFALQQKSPLIITNIVKPLIFNIKSQLHGQYQNINLSLSMAIIKTYNLNNNYLNNTNGNVYAYWPGRYEWIYYNTNILLDGAHNPISIKTTIKTIINDPKIYNTYLCVIISMTTGHDEYIFIKNLIKFYKSLHIKTIIITQLQHTSSIKTHILVNKFMKLGFNTHIIFNIYQALDTAIILANKYNGKILITGSLYLIGLLRIKFIKSMKDYILFI